MSFARNPKNGKLYFFQVHEMSMEWLQYPEMEGDYSLRWSTESRTWIPKNGIDMKDWTLNCVKALSKPNRPTMTRYQPKADGKFFINVHAVLT